MKKILAIVLAIAMIATLSVSTFAYEWVDYGVEFTTTDDWAEFISILEEEHDPKYYTRHSFTYYLDYSDMDSEELAEALYNMGLTKDEDKLDIIASALLGETIEGDEWVPSLVIEQTKGKDIATITGSVDLEEKIITIVVAPINTAKFVDLTKAEFKLEITCIEKHTGENVKAAAYYVTFVCPDYFFDIDIDVTDYSVFSNGTCFAAWHCAEYSEILKGHKVRFCVYDLADINQIIVEFENFQMYAPVNFVYTTSSEAEGYENVLCTIDFQTKSSVEGLGKVYVGELTTLAGLNLKNFSSDDEIKVYCDGKEVGVAEVEYDKEYNDYVLVFDLYHPTETTSYLGSYILATAVAAEEDAANPETGASSMVNVAVALAAVAMAAVAFVATKKSK